MASERQIESNRRNSMRSTGPSEAGLRTSRLNATKHGMTARLPEAEAAISPEFADRRAKWAVSFQPVDEPGEWALDRAVASSFQIERCERSINDLITDVQQRARLAWEEDRAVEAATTFGRLARDPILASRQLQTTLAGVVLLIEAWLLLVAPLEAGDDWPEAEASKALDLYGIAADLRSGRMLIDPPLGSDSVAFRLALALEEVERLEALRDEAMIPLDEMDRRHAMAGGLALLSNRAKLLLRYERDAWKRYNQSMKELKGQAPATPAVAPPTPKPVIVAPPAAPTRSVAPPRPSAAPSRQVTIDPPNAIDLIDEDAWLDAMEQRLEAMYSLPGSFVPVAAGSPGPLATERSQFEGPTGDRDPSRRRLAGLG
jgi:hypothetical protein